MMRQFAKLLVLVLVLTSAMALLPGRSAKANPLGATAWQAEYFNNLYLSGAANLVRSEGSLAFNWGNGSPGASIPADNFSARFGTDVYFTAGTYRFSVQADDEVRLKIGFNQWEPPLINTIDAPRPGQTLTADVTLTEGYHHIQVDFRERTGLAYLYLTWARVTGNPSPAPLPGQAIATVTTGALNVRAIPDAYNGQVLTRVYRGQTYPIVGRTGDSTWWQINVNGTVGWVNGGYVRAQNGHLAPVNWSGAPQPQPQPGPSLPIVQCQGFLPSRLVPGGWGRVTPGLPNNLRASTSSASAWVGQIPGGAAFQVITGPVCGFNTAWWQVNYNGVVGWTMEGQGGAYWLEPLR